MSKMKITFLVSTVLVSLMTVGGASRYLLDHEFIVGAFQAFRFSNILQSTPMAILKLLGVAMLWIGKPKFLNSLAYSGFFWNFSLAVSAHSSQLVMENSGALQYVLF